MKPYLKATFTLESFFPDSLTMWKLQIPNSLHGDTRRARGPRDLVPGARFSKVPIINGPGKSSPFILKIEVSNVLHLTW